MIPKDDELEEKIEELNNKKIEIIEEITNENGTAIKFSDGTMICYMRKNIQQEIISQYKSGTEIYYSMYTWEYPQAFVNTPTVTLGEILWQSGANWGSCRNAGNSIAQFVIFDCYDRPSNNTVISATAIGKWK